VASFWQAYRDRQSWKRTQTESRLLVKECRRIVKKKAYRIPETVSKSLEDACSAVERALDTNDRDATREALNHLDEQMDKNLAFARKSALREYSESIGAAVAIAILLRAFVVEAFQIPSGSMIPTLEVGDHIFVSKFSYGINIPFSDSKLVDFGIPKRGDVVVFKYPLDPTVDYIKRVVGLPGDRLKIDKNQIYVNDEPVTREHRGECEPSEETGSRPCDEWLEYMSGNPHRTIFSAYGIGAPMEEKRVPDGHIFVMGDNRDNSNDSRVWGFVPVELIKGRALVVWYSRNPKAGSLTPAGAVAWWKAIRWDRFFTSVD
jgi:signal peptidase I